MYNGSNTYTDQVAEKSVCKTAEEWADTLDVSGSNGGSSELTNFKNALKRFGAADNRRLCYIIELDKNPRDSSYDPMNGTNLDLDTGTAIQFLAQASSFIELDAEKPIIWETEAKKSTDIEIYLSLIHI